MQQTRITALLKKQILDAIFLTIKFLFYLSNAPSWFVRVKDVQIKIPK